MSASAALGFTRSLPATADIVDFSRSLRLAQRFEAEPVPEVVDPKQSFTTDVFKLYLREQPFRTPLPARDEHRANLKQGFEQLEGTRQSMRELVYETPFAIQYIVNLYRQFSSKATPDVRGLFAPAKLVDDSADQNPQPVVGIEEFLGKRKLLEVLYTKERDLAREIAGHSPSHSARGEYKTLLKAIGQEIESLELNRDHFERMQAGIIKRFAQYTEIEAQQTELGIKGGRKDRNNIVVPLKSFENQLSLGLSATDFRDLVTGLNQLDEKLLLQRNALVEANLRLVISVAKQWHSRHHSMPDLVQLGNVGLIRAVETFDHTVGASFSHWAVFWIKSSIRQGLMKEDRLIRIPQHALDDLREIRRARRSLIQELGTEPKVSQIAERVNMKPAEVDRLLKVSQEVSSLDAPKSLDDGDAAGLFATLADPKSAEPGENVMRASTIKVIGEALSTLSSTERQVMELLYPLDSTTAPLDIPMTARKLNLTSEKVRQIQVRVFRQLRHPSSGLRSAVIN